MDKKYETLDHPADLKIKAFGKTKKDLFLNMLLAMNESMKPEIKKPLEEVKKEIKIEAPDLEALFVDFLSEVLYLSQTNKEVYFNAEFKDIFDTFLVVQLIGKKVERFGEDIKAVTYYDLVIRKTGDGWEAIVVFDI